MCCWCSAFPLSLPLAYFSLLGWEQPVVLHLLPFHIFVIFYWLCIMDGAVFHPYGILRGLDIRANKTNSVVFC